MLCKQRMLRDSIFIQCVFERTAALIQLWKVFDRSKGHICAIYLEKANDLILAKILTIFKKVERVCALGILI